MKMKDKNDFILIYTFTKQPLQWTALEQTATFTVDQFFGHLASVHNDAKIEDLESIALILC